MQPSHIYNIIVDLLVTINYYTNIHVKPEARNFFWSGIILMEIKPTGVFGVWNTSQPSGGPGALPRVIFEFWRMYNVFLSIVLNQTPIQFHAEV